MAVFRILFLGLMLALVGQWACAQTATTTSAQATGGRTALYITKKGISYSLEWDKLLSSWVQQNDSIGLADEALRLAFAIRLGNYLGQVLKEPLKQDSIAFVNARPDWAAAMIAGYTEAGPTWAKIKTAGITSWAGQLLVLDVLELGGQEKHSVVGFSNRLFADSRWAPKAFVRFRLYDCKTERLKATYEASFDPDVDKLDSPLPTQQEGKRAQNLLNGLLNKVLQPWLK